MEGLIWRDTLRNISVGFSEKVTYALGALTRPEHVYFYIFIFVVKCISTEASSLDMCAREDYVIEILDDFLG